MRTIKFNGKNLDISASEERVLFTLFRHDFAAKRGDFVEGRGNYMKSILPEKSRWEQGKSHFLRHIHVASQAFLPILAELKLFSRHLMPKWKESARKNWSS